MNISTRTNKYLTGIWDSRYFWIHLALSDLRNKFRRSRLGILWALIQPLMLTLLLSFVMGSLFHRNIGTYALYVYSGIIVWSFIVDSGVVGATAFTSAEGYMKQFKHPLLIYTLRVTLYNLIVFLIAFMGLLLWTLIADEKNINWSIISLVPTLLLYFFMGWALSTIVAFIYTRFRDFQQLLILTFQAIWYASPVFIAASILEKIHNGILVYYNPVYHILNLVRDPLLQGIFPKELDYLYLICITAVFWLFAIFFICRRERDVIFSL